MWIYEQICLLQHSFSHWHCHQTFLQKKLHAHKHISYAIYGNDIWSTEFSKSAKAIRRAIPDFIIIIIIIIAHCASRHTRLSHCPPNPPVVCCCLGYVSALSPHLASLLFESPSPMVFGLPLTLQPSRVRPNVIKQSSTPSLLSTCPNQFHLLLCTLQLISLISAISTTLLFVILAAI